MRCLLSRLTAQPVFPARLSAAGNPPQAGFLHPDMKTAQDICPAGAEENVNVDTPERNIPLGSRHNPFAISTRIFFGLPRRPRFVHGGGALLVPRRKGAVLAQLA
jgi:hypothetical protein